MNEDELKYTLHLSKRHLRLLSAATENMARMGMGQFDGALEFLPRDPKTDRSSWWEDLRVIGELLAKHTPGDVCRNGQSLGIYSEETPEVAREMWDLYQVLRHQVVKEMDEPCIPPTPFMATSKSTPAELGEIAPSAEDVAKATCGALAELPSLGRLRDGQVRLHVEDSGEMRLTVTDLSHVTEEAVRKFLLSKLGIPETMGRLRVLREGANGPESWYFEPPTWGEGERTEFWAKNAGNFWLSNFYPAPITMKTGTVYPTSEHLYQISKLAAVPDSADYILHVSGLLQTPSPSDVKKTVHGLIGRKPDLIARARLMRRAIDLKFAQHRDLQLKLLETEGPIVEASPKDAIWGEGPEGTGLNLMGLLLMELRDKLRKEQQCPT